MNFLSQLTGCFAMPAAENPTVAMVEAAYQHHGLPWRYINCEVPAQGLADAVAGAKAMGWAGFNCSLPHKVAVIELLDGLGESARLMGAVNCAVRRDSRWIGENTDGKGFLASLREISDPQGAQVVVLGAGGASRAICVELALAGARRLTVVNRSPERGAELVDLLNGAVKKQISGAFTAELAAWDADYCPPPATDVLINATSIGLFPDVDAVVRVNLDALTPEAIVADVIPNPPRTRLLRDAEERGCRTLDGLGMLVNQGVAGIEYWTGIRPEASVMRAKLEEIFAT